MLNICSVIWNGRLIICIILHLKHLQTIELNTYEAALFHSGGTWKTGGQCHLETMPDFETPAFPDDHFNIVNDVILSHANTSQMPTVNLLNVTYLSLQRRDGHASIYYMGPKPASIRHQDCSHWCLPGVPDTWNELVFAVYLKQQSLKSRSSALATQAGEWLAKSFVVDSV